MFGKPYRVIDKQYIAWIKQMPCVVCMVNNPSIQDLSNSKSNPHHVNKAGHGSMGSKCSDLRTVPLCTKHHVEVHSGGRKTFERKEGVDFEAIIDELNRIWSEKNEAI